MNKHQAPIVLASLHTPVRHDSGPKHVAGSAEYIDDMIEPAGTMHAYLALSVRPHAEIVSIDWSLLAPDEAKRLRAMGIDEGARVAIAHRGIFTGRDPIAIEIGRMTVALRRAHARAMTVSEL